jgi:predicted RNase H-like HicB family nuclease
VKQETVTAQGPEFTVAIEPDSEEGGYIVHCPALKGCWSQGETIDEALTNITGAIIGCLAVRIEKAMARTSAQLRDTPFCYAP